MCKVRWSRPGTGCAGQHFNLTEEDVVLLVAVNAKADRGNMTPFQIKLGGVIGVPRPCVSLFNDDDNL